MKTESTSLVICGGRIIDPGQGVDQIGDLLIAHSRIARSGGAATISQAQSLDAAGFVVCPGFVDLHCHLREPGFENKETIATGTKAAALGGFTTVCCMPNTEPPLDTPAAVASLKQRASKEGSVTVLPIGCITKGRKDQELTDMAGLAQAGVVGFSDDGDPVANSQLMRRALEYSRELGLPIIDHCEDKTLSDNGIVNEGRLSAKLGLKGTPAAAEEIMVARDLILAKFTKARLHIAHVSTKGSVELIRRAKEDGISVTAEVTPHHLTLTEERIVSGATTQGFDTNAKVNPPLRTEEDVEALLKGLKDGVIDAIATDHAPHTLADKDCPPELAAFGISGLETAFGCLMSLVHQREISLLTLLSKLTCEPARVIGQNDQLGTLTVGAPANVTILDPGKEWIVNSRNFASKGKNTPYDGYKFKGKVMATIANGRIVYMDESLRSRLVPVPCHSNPAPYHPEHNEESYV
ncbi:MAG: dihydroorotase [Dehalococcoidia bacterium]